MSSQDSELKELRQQLSSALEERDYYRQISEKLGKKHLSDSHDFSGVIRDLRQREQQLRQGRDELEKTIAERTAELVRSNRELNESSNRYDELVQLIPNGVYTLRILSDESMQFEYLSPKICQILGIQATDLLQDASLAFTIAHPDDRDSLISTTMEANRKLVPFRWEGRFIIHGKSSWIRIESDPVRTPEGDVLWNGVLSDVSDRRNSEEKLKVSEELYRHLTELAPNAITVADVSGVVRMLNPRSIQLFGLGQLSDAIDTNIFEWVSPACMESAVSAFEELLLNGSATDINLTLLRKDGSEFIAEISASVLRNSEGQPRLLILVVFDITQRKYAERELHRKNADLEQFIYTVSHDLRSPLVTIKTFLGYLKDDIATNSAERVTQDLQYIHSASDKMRQLLDELLDLCRVDHVETSPVTITLREIVTEVLDLLAGSIDEQSIKVHLPEADLVLSGDRQRFCQIWQNLIENAIKYSRGDTAVLIEVGVQQAEGETTFFVRDNGIGIAPQYHEKIFGLFEKLDGTSSGVGIGLAMVRRIIEKYDGRIWVESDGEDTGACFFFTLPDAVRNITEKTAGLPSNEQGAGYPEVPATCN
ncbi:MAG: PAS domain S-box protein [Geobacteraceae bacterium]|nr:PAS domain S-box protein [Geobacteraceae bacterium]